MVEVDYQSTSSLYALVFRAIHVALELPLFYWRVYSLELVSIHIIFMESGSI